MTVTPTTADTLCFSADMNDVLDAWVTETPKSTCEVNANKSDSSHEVVIEEERDKKIIKYLHT